MQSDVTLWFILHSCVSHNRKKRIDDDSPACVYIYIHIHININGYNDFPVRYVKSPNGIDIDAVNTINTIYPNITMSWVV